MGTNFWGQYVEFFGHNGIRFIDGTIVAKLAADPTITAAEGQESSLGMFGSNLYVKTDNGSSTNWKLLADDAALQAHLSSNTAHAIADITYDNTTSGLTATDGQAAIDEVEGRLDTAETNIGTNVMDIANHIASNTAHDAADIVYDNTGSGLTGVNTQAAIDQLDSRLDAEEATTRQDMYLRSPDGDISLNSTQGKIAIKDNATPLVGNLFEVTNDAEDTQYLEVDAKRTAVTDRDGTRVLRKDVDIFYIEDFKVNDPSDVVTVTGSWTLDNAQGPIEGHQVCRLSSGTLGSTAQIDGILLNQKAQGLLMGLLVDFKYNQNSTDIQMDVLESPDNITYTVLESMTLAQATDVKIAKLLHKFNSGSNYTGIRFTVLNASGGTLEFKNIRWEYDPTPTAEFTKTESFRARNYAGRGSVNNKIPYFANVVKDTTGDLVSITNDSTTDGGGLQITAKRKCSITFTWSQYGTTGQGTEVGISINSTQLTAQFVSINENDKVGYSRNSPVSGENFAHSTTASVEMEAGDILRPHTDGQNPGNALNSFANFTATEISTNVLFKGQSGGSIVEKILTSNQSNNTDITDLRVSGLEIGREYEVNVIAYMNSTSGGILAYEGTWGAGELIHYQAVDRNGLSIHKNGSFRFVATTDTLRFHYSGSTLFGDGTRQITSVQLYPVDQINSIPVTDEVENVFSARIDSLGGIMSQNSSWIQSINKVGSDYTVTWNTDMFGLEPAVNVQPFRLNSSDANVTLRNVTPTGFTYRTETSSGGIATDFAVEIILQRQGSDYRAPQGHFIGNMPLVSYNTSGDEYWTGLKQDGRRVMARSFKTGTNLSGSHPNYFFTESGLDILDAEWTDGFTYQIQFAQEGTSYANADYDPNDGGISIFTSGGFLWFAQRVITIRYLE